MPGEASGKERHMKKEIYKAKNDLPYEKFMRLGSHILTEAELLAITIRTGTKDRKAVEIGQEILSLPSVKEHGLGGLYYVTIQELMEIKGIGQVKAVKLKCLAELSMRIAMATAKEGLRFLDPSSVAKYYMESLRREKRRKSFSSYWTRKNGCSGKRYYPLARSARLSFLQERYLLRR